MLEELVENEKHPPAETAQAMLSFLQNDLPIGGTASEKRFLELFIPLCNRIFGKLLDSKDNFRHKEGGWFSAQTPWPRITAASASSTTARTAPGASPSNRLKISTQSRLPDPVLMLLGTAQRPTKLGVTAPNYSTASSSSSVLMEVMSKEGENRRLWFKFPFQGLPKSLQDEIIHILAFPVDQIPLHVTVSENVNRLLWHLLSIRPTHQTEVKRYQQQISIKKNATGTPLTPHGGGMMHSFGSPLSPRQASPTGNAKRVDEEITPQLFLSMLEYYLVLLIRYPLFIPLPKQPMLNRRTSVGPRRGEPYGETVYMEVLSCSLRHFLPHGQAQHEGFAVPSSELFLRLIISMWIEQQNPQMETTARVVQMMGRRSGDHLSQQSQPQPLLDLEVSFDLVHSKMNPPCSQVQKGLRKVLVHLICDPVLKNQVVQLQSSSTSGDASWCLPAAMTALQQPMYNQIRTAFRHATLHSSGSPFYSTFSAWLIWLEPWNVGTRREFSPRATIMKKPASQTGASNTALTIPAHTTKSKYTAAWEPYVAANLYMYVVPLAIFLRRSRELDFSSGKSEGSIKLVQRAFRVFTPELVGTLNQLLGGHSQWSGLAEKHRSILGVFAPPLGPMTMQSLKKDMQSLLEEIQMQHVKKLRELDSISRMINKVEHMFGQGVASRDEKSMRDLLARARVIVQSDLELDLLKGMDNSNAALSNAHAGGDDIVPQRTATGELSASGKEELLRGQVKCDPSRISFRGDKMRLRPMTYEIGFLVTFLVWLSDLLNKKFEIDPDDKSRSFRFNLRFLADYRNLLSIVVVAYIVGIGR